MSPHKPPEESLFDTPKSDGCVANNDASLREQVFDITIAEVESMLEPDRVTDDVGRKSVTLISIHRQIIDQQQLTCQYLRTHALQLAGETDDRHRDGDAP